MQTVNWAETRNIQQIATKYHLIFVKYDTKSRSVLEQTLYQKKKSYKSDLEEDLGQGNQEWTK